MTNKELENLYLELHATVSLFWSSEEPRRKEVDKELGYLKEIYRLAKLGLAVEQWPDDYAIEKHGSWSGNPKYWRGEDLTITRSDGIRDTPRVDSFTKVINLANEEVDPTP